MSAPTSRIVELPAAEISDGFPEFMWDAIGYYVYRLTDPTNGDRTFYVGKGKGNRVFDHARGRKLADDFGSAISLKLGEIDRIIKTGHPVGYVVHRHGLTEAEAFHVEAALIDAYPGLTNMVSGHGRNTKGMMHVRDIVVQYGLPDFPERPDHDLLLIKIPKLGRNATEREIFRLVRYCWRLDPVRASRAEYVVAVHMGRTLGVYKAHQWLPATFANFGHAIPGTMNDAIPYSAGDTESHRFGFHGAKAPDYIWKLYVGAHGMRFRDISILKAQNAIRYLPKFTLSQDADAATTDEA